MFKPMATQKSQVKKITFLPTMHALYSFPNQEAFLHKLNHLGHVLRRRKITKRVIPIGWSRRERINLTYSKRTYCTSHTCCLRHKLLLEENIQFSIFLNSFLKHHSVFLGTICKKQ